jgi:hypothetical protein
MAKGNDVKLFPKHAINVSINCRFAPAFSSLDFRSVQKKYDFYLRTSNAV